MDSQQIIMLVVLAVLVVAVIAFYVYSSKKRKKSDSDAKALIDAVKPGNKVKTIGGICGIVVEVNAEDNTFVLETGSELSGKSYMKFDKQAIYQTDAVLSTAEPKAVEEQVETEENNSTEVFEETVVEDKKEVKEEKTSDKKETK